MGNSIVLKRRLSVALGIFLISSGCSPKPQTGEKDNLSLNKMSETKGSAELDSHQHIEGQPSFRSGPIATTPKRFSRRMEP
jgi:hypothetical protein